MCKCPKGRASTVLLGEGAGAVNPRAPGPPLRGARILVHRPCSGGGGRGVGPRHDGAPGEQLGPQRTLELAELVGQVGLGGPRRERLANRSKSRDIPPRRKYARESNGQRRRGSPPSATARRSGPMASPERSSFRSASPEAPEDIGRRRTLLRVLDAEAENLFALATSRRATHRTTRASRAPWR